MTSPDPAPGRVTLVGGGPGDPDLLTLAGLRALQSADIILTDHLAPDVSTLVNGTEVYCACDSQGTTAKPRFLSSMSFTCQGIVDIIRGDVSGRNGDRIRNWRIDEIKPKTQGGSELNIGGCVRTR